MAVYVLFLNRLPLHRFAFWTDFHTGNGNRNGSVTIPDGTLFWMWSSEMVFYMCILGAFPSTLFVKKKQQEDRAAWRALETIFGTLSFEWKNTFNRKSVFTATYTSAMPYAPFHIARAFSAFKLTSVFNIRRKFLYTPVITSSSYITLYCCTQRTVRLTVRCVCCAWRCSTTDTNRISHIRLSHVRASFNKKNNIIWTANGNYLYSQWP